MLSRNSEGYALIWGLKISELVGVVGFFIASITGIVTLVQWLQGSEIQFSGPRLVGIECDETVEVENGEYHCADRTHFLVRASSLTYTNTASGQYNATISNEKVIVKFVAEKDVLMRLELNFQYFSDQTRYSTEETTAKPFVVSASSSVANETLFFPWDRQCRETETRVSDCDRKKDFLKWTNFLDFFDEENGEATIDKIYLKFVSTETGGALFGAVEEHSAYCFIDVAGDRIDYQENGMEIYQRTFVCHEVTEQMFDEVSSE